MTVPEPHAGDATQQGGGAALRIWVNRASNLHQVDLVKMDVYCVVTMCPKRSPNRAADPPVPIELRTPTAKDVGRHPFWNFRSVIEIDDAKSAGPNTLDFEVYDKDDFGGDEFIGRGTLGVKDFIRGWSGDLELQRPDKGGVKSAGSLNVRVEILRQVKIKIISAKDLPDPNAAELSTTISISDKKAFKTPLTKASDGNAKWNHSVVFNYDRQHSIVLEVKNNLSGSVVGRGVLSMTDTFSGWGGELPLHKKDGKSAGVIIVDVTWPGESLSPEELLYLAPGPRGLGVKINYARDLYNTEMFGKMDPYCIVRACAAKEPVTTQVAQNQGKNPVWNHRGILSYENETHFHVQVFDKDMMSKDDFVGEAFLEVPQILTDWTGDVEIFRKEGTKAAGFVNLSLLWQQRLRIQIHSGQGLYDTALLGDQDVFVMARLSNEKSTKTPLLKDSGVNPVWQYETLFAYDNESTLQFQVMDKNVLPHVKLETGGLFPHLSLTNETFIGRGEIPAKPFSGKVQLLRESKEPAGFLNVDVTLPDAKFFPEGEVGAGIKQKSQVQGGVGRDFHVKVNYGRDLFDTALIGKMDCYVKVRLSGRKGKKSGVVKGSGREPTWNFQSTFTYEGEPTMEFEIWDQGALSVVTGDTLVGRASKSMREVLAGWCGDVKVFNKTTHAAGVLNIDVQWLRQINITIVKATNLYSTEYSTLMDPYCKIVLSPDKKIQTRVLDGAGINPVWNYKGHLAYEGEAYLEFQVFDKDTFTADDFVGEVRVEIDELQKGFAGDLQLIRKGSNEAGLLTIKIEWPEAEPPKAGPISVRGEPGMECRIWVMHGVNLYNTETFGQMDPFTIVRLAKDKRAQTPAITDVGRNPIWHSSFVFTYESEPAIEFEVYDKDTLSRNDFIGRSFLGLDGVLTGFDGNVDLIRKDGKEAGKLGVRVEWLRQMRIRVNNAKNLRQADLITEMSTYCKVRLSETKHSVSAKVTGKNPEWFHESVFSYDHETVIEFDVFDHDMIGRDDLVGRAVLSVTDLLRASVSQSGGEGGALGITTWSGEVKLYTNDSSEAGTLEVVVEWPGEPIGTKEMETLLPGIHQMQLNIRSARNLYNTEVFGKMDPYCRCTLGVGKSRRTSVAQNQGQTPTWNYETVLDHRGEPGLVFEVYDKDTMSKDDFVGEGFQSLTDIQKDFAGDVELFRDMSAKNPKFAGQVNIKIEWLKKLRVKIVKGYDLFDAETFGKMDCYAVVKLSNSKEARTTVLTDSGTTPMWNFETIFPYNNESVLEVAVYDKESITQDDFVGKGLLQISGLNGIGGGWAGELDLHRQDKKPAGKVVLSVDWPENIDGSSTEGHQPLIIGGVGMDFKIRVFYARDLYNTETFGKMDPYCRVMLSRQKTERTHTIQGAGRNPSWDWQSILTYEGEPELTFEVFEADSFSRDDFVGSGKLPMGEALAGWSGDLELTRDIGKAIKNAPAGRINIALEWLRQIKIHVSDAAFTGPSYDAYCVIKLSNEKSAKSDRIPSRNPTWDLQASFPYDGESAIDFEVYEYDLTGPSLIGHGKITVRDIMGTNFGPERLAIRTKDDNKLAGTLGVTVEWPDQKVEEIAPGPKELRIRVNHATSLRDSDWFGKMDVSVKVSVSKEKVQKSKLAKKAGRNPLWNEEFSFEYDGEPEIKFEVFDDDSGGSGIIEESLGQGFVKTREAIRGWHGDVDLTRKGKFSGKVNVDIEWLRHVNITVHGCQNLFDADLITTMDTYCKFRLANHDEERNPKKLRMERRAAETPVAKKSGRDPVWNYEALMCLNRETHIYFDMYDKDTFTDESLGYANLRLADVWANQGFSGKVPVYRNDSEPAGHLNCTIKWPKGGTLMAASPNDKEKYLGPGYLKVYVNYARDLKDTELMGKMDCYCKVVMSDSKQDITPMLPESGRFPTWDWSVIFEHDTEDTIDFLIYDADVGVDDFVGRARMSLKGAPAEGWSGDLPLLRSNGEVDAGVLNIGIEWLPRMRVTVLNAQGLYDTDVMNKMDPYVKVRLSNTKCAQTPVLQSIGINPTWNYETCFGLEQETTIEFEVYDKDLLSRDDFVGAAILPVAEARRVPKWFGDLTLVRPDGNSAGKLRVKVEWPGDQSTAWWDKVRSSYIEAQPHNPWLADVVKELRVRIKCGRDLYNTELLGKMNCYCVVSTAGKRPVHRFTGESKVAGRHPVWDWEASFPIEDNRCIDFSVYDKDLLSSDDLVGSATINLTDIPYGWSGEMPLVRQGSKPAGLLQISLDWLAPVVVQCTYGTALYNTEILPPCIKEMSPYVEIRLSNRKVARSQVGEGGTYPTWDYDTTFAFDRESQLRFEVYDKKLITKDKFVGSGKLDVCDILDGYSGYVELERPDEKPAGTINVNVIWPWKPLKNQTVDAPLNAETLAAHKVPLGGVLHGYKYAHRDPHVRECLLYFLFVGIFCVVTMMVRPVHTLFMVHDAILTELAFEAIDPKGTPFRKTFYDIANYDDFWLWTDTVLYEKAFQCCYNNNQPKYLRTDNNAYTIGMFNRIMTPIRFRQIRMKKNTCFAKTMPLDPSNTEAFRLDNFTDPCWGHWSPSHELTENVWENSKGKSEYTAWFDGQAELYGDTDDGNDYGTSGWVVDLVLDSRLAGTRLQKLKEERWTDEYTVALSVEMNTYNPNYDVATASRFIIDVGPGGRTSMRVDQQSCRLNPYLHLIDYVRGIFEIAFCFLLVYYIRVEMLEMVELGLRRYLNSFWNWVELFNYILYLYIIYIWVQYNRMDRSVFQQRWSTEHQDLYSVASLYMVTANTAALNIIWSFVKVFKYLRLDNSFLKLWDVLAHSTKTILPFLIVICLIFLAFAWSGHWLYGSKMYDMHTLGLAFAYLCRSCIEGFDYDELKEASPGTAPLWATAWQIISAFVLLNMFIAILKDSYTYISDRTELQNALEKAFPMPSWKSYLEMVCCFKPSTLEKEEEMEGLKRRQEELQELFGSLDEDALVSHIYNSIGKGQKDLEAWELARYIENAEDEGKALKAACRWMETFSRIANIPMGEVDPKERSLADIQDLSGEVSSLDTSVQVLAKCINEAARKYQGAQYPGAD